MKNRRKSDSEHTGCASCGRRVFANFRACPHCGYDPKLKATPEQVAERSKRIIRRPVAKESN